MRTVTFSDSEVAKYINENFIAAWHDRGPGFHNDDKSTEQWIYQGNYETYPTKNICTFFLDVEGKVFFYASGYWAPDFFLEITKSALKLSGDTKIAAALADKCDGIAKALLPQQPANKNRGVPGGIKGISTDPEPVETQTKYQTAAAPVPAKDVPKFNWCRMDAYRGLKHTHSEACNAITGMGFQYLAKVFRSYAGAKELPNLLDIQMKYLYGNEFTEESGKREAITPTVFDKPTPQPVDSVDGRARREMLAARRDSLRQRMADTAKDDPSRADLQKLLAAISKELDTPQSR